MRSSSDPRDWYRREEQATGRARRRMSRKGIGPGLAPVYIAAAVIGIFAVYLLLLAAGVAVPGADH